MTTIKILILVWVSMINLVFSIIINEKSCFEFITIKDIGHANNLVTFEIHSITHF